MKTLAFKATLKELAPLLFAICVGLLTARVLSELRVNAIIVLAMASCASAIAAILLRNSSLQSPVGFICFAVLVIGISSFQFPRWDEFGDLDSDGVLNFRDSREIRFDDKFQKRYMLCQSDKFVWIAIERRGALDLGVTCAKAEAAAIDQVENVK